MKDKAIIYLRKSLEDSTRQTESVKDQQRYCEKILIDKWLDLVEVIQEDKSAKNLWREWFRKMVTLIEKWKANIIIAWKMDRIARNPKEWWEIKSQ